MNPSSARANPDLDVFVLFSHDIQRVSESSQMITRAVFSYPNVHVYKFDPIEYTKHTVLEQWMRGGKLFTSKHIVHHVSDILRILTLWKYSGTYFDLDVIVKKPVSERGNNFACIQRDQMIVSGIVNLSGDLGRFIAEKNLKHVVEHFDGNSWVGNGPAVLSDIIKKMCSTTDTSQMHRVNCNGFEVLPTRDCYAIDYSEWQKFFDPNFTEESENKTKDAFVVHFWNYLSGGAKLTTDSKAFYVELAREFCPKVFEASGEVF
jgi:lactosylceramide 4-alpha-galactosyltransferase